MAEEAFWTLASPNSQPEGCGGSGCPARFLRVGLEAAAAAATLAAAEVRGGGG